MKMKKEEFIELLNELATCNKCTNLACENKSLFNIYQDVNFCTNIPSIWTDWLHHLDAQIMIIGQDWGPYQDMQKLNQALNLDKSNWQELINSEKSNTKKLLDYYIKTSSSNKYTLDDIFITNAIMCARKGSNYRGNNIALKKSTLNCSSILLAQINIVKPKVILTLGYYPLLSLSHTLNFTIAPTLKETIAKRPEIKAGDYIIIPLYHPVAQITKEEQLKQYLRIWDYI